MESNIAMLQEELSTFGHNNSYKSASQTRRELDIQTSHSWHLGQGFVNQTSIVRSVFREDKEHVYCHVTTHLYVIY